MSTLAKLEFLALDITGKNYLSWVLDAEIHLNANNLGDTVKEGIETTTQDKAKAMIFLRRHIDDDLKTEYITIKDPLVLWTKLKERYDHQKMVILPRARYEWIQLGLQDFKSISEYNSAMFRITSQLILCGENITDKDMLEKTLSTFHESNMLLQQQYRERGFTKYCELISCLLVAEQNNELLMKNHETHLVGTKTVLGANVSTCNEQQGSHGRGRGYNKRNYNGVQFKTTKVYQKWQENAKNSMDKGGRKKNVTTSNACHRCGSDNHWARTCRTPKHLVGLYQQSIKNKGKGKAIKTNFTYEVRNIDVPGGILNNTTNLDIDDFLTDPTNLDSGDVMVDAPQLDACNFPYM